MAAGFSFVINLLMLVPSLYMLQIYDRVLSSRNVDTLLMLTLLAAVSYLLFAIIDWIRARLLINAGIALDSELSPRLFQAFLTESAQMTGKSQGQAFADANSLRQFLTGSGLFALFDAPWAPLFLAIIFFLHPALGAVALVGAILLVILAWVSERMTYEPLESANRLQGLSSQSTEGYGRNHDAVLAMGMLEALRSRWLERQAQWVGLQALASRHASSVASTSRLIRMLQQMAILGVGALLAIDGKITPGAMIAASLLMARALAPLDLAIASWREFFKARAAFDRLQSLLARNPASQLGLKLPEPAGDITVEGVTLVPPGAVKAVLTDVSFQIRRGTTIGVIGPSGSGKSCLAKLLVGVWVPQKGTMRLDGAVISDWDRERLGPHIGYLPQFTELLDGTVAENIARFGPQDAAKIVGAAKSTGIHDLILRLPQGYETRVGPHGLPLSGGQRQRIGLARAIHGSPTFVVLDEPNANLDYQGEAALMNVLAELKARSATVIIMTHRRSILDVSDGVLTLQNGLLQAVAARSPAVPALREVPAVSLEAHQ